ncbi:MAG TPA: glycosyltransferase [Candidatus Acidoferrales bacterium]|nr:glycosyltransferase [Candidatus Acidoferrales bacterium]
MGNLRPLLVVGDAVSSGTGLGRITGMIASGIFNELSDKYRMATAGYGGPGSRIFPFPQYTFVVNDKDWVIPQLRQIWEDWSNGERGVVMFVWDPSRLGWFAQPDLLSETLESYPGMRRWLRDAPFEKWLYCPLDAEGPGPNGELTFPVKATLLGFNRIIAYTRWGAKLIEKTIGSEEAEARHLIALPHGIDDDIFFEMPRRASRMAFLTRTGAMPIVQGMKAMPIEDDETLIGIVATNQPRKDWSLALKTCALLSKTRKIRVWAHTDKLEAAWSIPALLLDYELIDKALVSLNHLTDDNMAVAYSACDLTLAPGRGEGFGFPLVESVFCGTPCLHGNYAGGAEVLSQYPDFLVDPVAFQDEGEYLCRRPVFTAEEWAARANDVVDTRVGPIPYYDWINAWEQWKTYLVEAFNHAV